jgi:hypothetical protein
MTDRRRCTVFVESNQAAPPVTWRVFPDFCCHTPTDPVAVSNVV